MSVCIFLMDRMDLLYVYKTRIKSKTKKVHTVVLTGFLCRLLYLT